jgi:mono/diheme cytochrome c family protein
LPTVTPIPVYEFVAPTEPPQLATVAALTAAANTGDSLDPEMVERGRGRYEALECGICHGVSGEGTDEGPALTGTTLSEDDFISFLRSGGTIGPDHQYSTNRLSDSGGRNLYLYILSLGSE